MEPFTLERHGTFEAIRDLWRVPTVTLWALSSDLDSQHFEEGSDDKDLMDI